MICVEFKEWLIDREFADDKTSAAAGLHRQHCDACRALYDLDLELEAIISADMLTVEPPARLRRKIDAGINLGKSSSPIWSPWGLVPLFVAATLLVFFVYPFAANEKMHGFTSVAEVGQMALDDHLRDVPMAFAANEVTDVEGWFATVHGIAFSMPRLTEEGYVFVGGRKCQLGKCDVVYLLYAKDGKRVSVFVLPESDIQFPIVEGQEYGMQVAQSKVKLWKDGEQVLAMVI